MTAPDGDPLPDDRSDDRSDDGTDAPPDDGPDDPLDPRLAAALAASTIAGTRRSLRISAPLVYTAWGLAWLGGLGAMWLSVRDQQPYRGPSGAAGGVLAGLLLLALVATMADVLRSSRGVAGPSRIQQAMYGWAWPAAFGVLGALQGALARDGAAPRTLGTLGAVGPVLVTSTIYVVGAALWTDRVMFALGLWLAVVAAAAAFAGPVGGLAIGALAGGGAFLVAAAGTAVAGARRRTASGSPG